MIVSKQTSDKIDTFFNSAEIQQSLTNAAKKLELAANDFMQIICDQFCDYLKDDFRLQYRDMVRDEVILVVAAILKGDLNIMREFNLVPDNWGLRGDHLSIRKKIIEDYSEIIRNTHIQDLEQQLARAREMIAMYRDRI